MPLQTTEMPAITSVMAQRSPADLIAILLDSTEGINCDLQEIKKAGPSMATVQSGSVKAPGRFMPGSAAGAMERRI